MRMEDDTGPLPSKIITLNGPEEARVDVGQPTGVSVAVQARDDGLFDLDSAEHGRKWAVSMFMEAAA